ncbi:uncharacterized protein BKCO1_2400069 [Diplodia corticola]|uniref:DUF4604 domain-containing protein n=1 Tax=Diplodia corticola TaxID=236234 RepID=A0A1J9S2S6_9PEZI|nr:uncharacterized protein BKCO1_2400069 [Diplodia corticola]OJD34308.1 hypothetical protein BKCO1_2400069 [Diplodia corticola]
MAFNPKNLSYDHKEPAFLRRMKGDLTAGRDTDRHERPVARPKRLKRDDEEDDGPTYVVEESNDTLTKAEYEALVNGTTEESPAAHATSDAAEGKDGDEVAAEKAKPKQQQVASVGGASKKRKAVKIGGDADDEERDESRADEKSGKAEDPQKKETKPKKPKKKAKAVKLSFGDED